MSTPGQIIESKSQSSETPEVITKISGRLFDTLKIGDDPQVRADCLLLLERSKSFQFTECNPHRIVNDLIRTIRQENFNTATPQTQVCLAQTLHAYVDLSILKMAQEDSRPILQSSKEEDISDLAIVIKKIEALSKGMGKETLYALSCAQVGLSILNDTGTWSDEALKVFKLLAGLIINIKNIDKTVSSIQLMYNERAAIWYIDVLKIRILTPWAQQSLPHLDILRRELCTMRMTTNPQWQIRYAAQEALAQVVLAGRSYIIKRTAFLGDGYQLKLSYLHQLIKSVFPQLKIDEKLPDEHICFVYRAISSLKQFSEHPETWLRNEAEKLKQQMNAVIPALVDISNDTHAPVQIYSDRAPELKAILPPLESKTFCHCETATQLHVTILEGDALLTTDQAHLRIRAADHYLKVLSMLEQSDPHVLLATTSTQEVESIQLSLQQRLDQLWVIELYHALYPLFINAVAEKEDPRFSKEQLNRLALPLYQGLQRHQLHAGITILNKIVNSQQEIPAVISDEKPYWFKARSELLALRATLLQAKESTCVMSIDTYVKKVKEWLNEYTQHIIKLLGDAPYIKLHGENPCGFCILLPNLTPSLIGTSITPLRLMLLIENDFYSQDPYFQSLFRLLTFSLNQLGDGLSKVDTTSIDVEVGVNQEGIMTLESLQNHLELADVKKEQAEFINYLYATEVYTNESGKKLYRNYQEWFLTRLEFIHSDEKQSSPAQTVVSLPPVESKDKHKSLAESKRAVLDVTKEIKTAPSPQKPSLECQDDEVEADQDSFERRSAEMEKAKLTATSQKKKTPFSEKHHHQLVRSAYPELYKQSQITETKDVTVIVEHCISSLQNWCQLLAVYLKYIHKSQEWLSNPEVINDVSEILSRLESDGLFATRFIQEMKKIWQLAHYIHLQATLQRLKRSINEIDIQELLWLEQHVLQPAWKALNQWFTHYPEIVNSKTKLAPVDPIFFNLQAYAYKTPITPELKLEIKVDLIFLIENLSAREYDLTKHLRSYHQNPLSLREDYLILLKTKFPD